MNAIELINVNFTYHGVKDTGLKNINLKIKKGEFILLTGRSGCGKTTLTRLINGLIPHFFPGELTGRVIADNTEVQHASTYELAEKVGSVFQDPRSQFFTTNTISEVAFGCENLGLSSVEINQRISDAFSTFQIENLKNRSIFSLSSGEKQKIALASTYAMRPSIYVLDEPSANLDIYSTKMLGKLLKNLKEQGYTIIVSEHRLYYLMDLVDRVLYMKDGSIVDEWTSKEALGLSETEIIKKGLRAFNLDNLMQIKQQLIQPFESRNPYEFIAKDISVTLSGQHLLKNVSLSVNKQGLNDIVGITGANGVGKTTLVKCLCGLLKKQFGTVKVNGKILSNRNRAREMYFVMQDTDYQLFTESVEDELRLGNQKGKILDGKIDETLDMLGLNAYRNTHPMALSGGQKQRVTIASAAVNSAKVLFFDEPTSGLDGENMRSVSQILTNLYQSGKLVFVISHDLEFLLNTCSKIIHLQGGTVTDDFLLNSQTVNKLKSLLFAEKE